MKKIWFFFLLSQITNFLYSQGEIIEKTDAFFKDEKTLGLSLNSNGFGFDLKYAKRIDFLKKSIYHIDFAEVKHPKELPFRISASQKKYVWGKVNSFYNMRFGIGIQKELYSKFDVGGIAIRQYWHAGLSLGLLKPIYYEVVYSITDSIANRHEIVIEDFETYYSVNHTPGTIYGKASFFHGIGGTKLVPGVFLKYGFNFEYDKAAEKISALEAGVVIDAFAKEIPIMLIENNNQIFLSFFLSYRFGKVNRSK